MASNCSSSAVTGSASKTKTKKKHFVCQKVKLFRASEPLLSVLMWGVNHTINELSNVPVPVMLMPDDFKAYSKIKVDNHLFNKENLPSRFKFKEYCPMVFRNLRERFGIDDQDYQNSLTRSAPVNSETQGRFGSRFLTTFDRRFVIKTISSEDVAEMHNILKKYHQFIVECHGNTLLPQFLGMYRLTVDGVETYMVVTRNVFSHRLGVHRKYDLKGSTVSREASDKEKAKELPTFKDNDFLNEGQKLHVGEENKKIFLEKLKRDVEFLSVLKIMDYSLLVGLHDVDRAEQEEMEVEERAEEEECEDGSGNPICSYGTPPDSPGNLLNFPRFFGPGEFDPSVDVYAMKSHDSPHDAPKKEVYFMAIIDILTPYDAKKKAAHAAKTVKHGAGAEISTVNPEQYSKRFFEFMSNIIA
ncbi:phosphatidylinositol 5-phosphate 4-kinase type-2 beta [Pelobates cultripes]|uniref:Phosphatidylinositol 5-phosphate 4-kinase type-2 gamma n=1 Tax=Pelobates cultripes TaxID=61616 RepID=A0AAD1WF54_PELCU|nr:phosphatidylinositol 5-phosphate 4-kinase type-2 beta [Pelobates cultripes]